MEGKKSHMKSEKAIHEWNNTRQPRSLSHASIWEIPDRCYPQEVLLGCDKEDRWLGKYCWWGSGSFVPCWFLPWVGGCWTDKCWTADCSPYSPYPSAKIVFVVCLEKNRLFRAVFRHHHRKADTNCFTIWQLFAGHCGYRWLVST